MCTDDHKFTTVVGPRRSVEQLIELFPQTSVASRHGIDSRVELIDLESLSPDFADPESPAAAVIHHGGASAFQIAAELQAEVLTGHDTHGLPPLAELLCEPGYHFFGAAVSSGPSVSLLPHGISRLTSTAPVVAAADRAYGSRVALLDTGMVRSSHPMVDFTVSPPAQVPATDADGHGTAVAQVITSMCPHADIHPLRVLGPVGRTAPSYRVFGGLIHALWSGGFDIVNASLTTLTSDLCQSSLGSSISYIVRYCHQRSRQIPLIVAAAGNFSHLKSGYPALVPGAIVALALEEDASSPTRYRRAGYNSTPPNPAIEVETFGGTRSDPIGTVSSSAGANDPLYGTSLAAAAVTAAYIP